MSEVFEQHVIFYCSMSCSVCEGQGLVAFRRCSDGQTLVLLCDECEAIWLTPELLSDPNSSTGADARDNYAVPGTHVSPYGDNAGWATRAEIIAAGLEALIVGEREITVRVWRDFRTGLERREVVTKKWTWWV